MSVADGLIAALVFFVLQGLVGFAAMRLSKTAAVDAQTLWIAFCIAGAATYAIMRLVYWRARTADVPRILGEGVPQALLLGATWGIAAALAAVVYLQIARWLGFVPPPAKHPNPWLALALVAVIIAAAPVFEEFIFRGLIFKGLRRSFGPVVATLASAAIFALVHPPFSVFPVFILGVCAAVAYERTGMLAAPMISHAVYNAVAVGLQWNAIYG